LPPQGGGHDQPRRPRGSGARHSGEGQPLTSPSAQKPTFGPPTLYYGQGSGAATCTLYSQARAAARRGAGRERTSAREKEEEEGEEEEEEEKERARHISPERTLALERMPV